MSKNTQNGLVNINLQPFADVTNNVINKFAEAVGWIATPRGARKDMEIATEVYIEEIKNEVSLPPIVKAQKISQARKEIKEYCNLQDIINHAEEFGQAYDNYDDDPMDEDWAMFFYDRAKNISREDAKVIWGKILAEECKQKGSIPKVLIHILSIIDEEDAKLFDKLCSFRPGTIENNLLRLQPPLIYDLGTNNLPVQHGLLYHKLSNLEAIGLIQYGVSSFARPMENVLPISAIMYDCNGKKVIIKKLNNRFPIGNVVFTAAGEILANCIERKPINGFAEYVAKYYRDNGFGVEIVK